MSSRVPAHTCVFGGRSPGKTEKESKCLRLDSVSLGLSPGAAVGVGVCFPGSRGLCRDLWMKHLPPVCVLPAWELNVGVAAEEVGCHLTSSRGVPTPSSACCSSLGHSPGPPPLPHAHLALKGPECFLLLTPVSLSVKSQPCLAVLV